MTFLIGLFIGVLGSFLATLLWAYLGEPVFFNLSYGIRPISGDYIASYPDNPDWGDESVNIKQLGSRIYGEFKEPTKREKYKVTGQVISSTMAAYQFKPKNKKLNDYGVGFIRIAKEGDGGSGYVLYLSDTDEKPIPVRIKIKSVPRT